MRAQEHTDKIVKNRSAKSRTTERVNTLARSKSKRAIEIIGAIMEDTNAPHNVRLKAAEAMLTRAIGAPVQKNEHNVEVNLGSQHLEALQRMAAERLAAIDSSNAKELYAEKNGQNGLHNGTKPLVIEHNTNEIKVENAKALPSAEDLF